jgi:hypothetical protein
MAKSSGQTEGLTHSARLPRRRVRRILDPIGDLAAELNLTEHEVKRRLRGFLGVGDPDEGGGGQETEATASEATPDLTEEEWLQAELIVLGREAKARAASLDATRNVVDATCDHLLAGDGR